MSHKFGFVFIVVCLHAHDGQEALDELEAEKQRELEQAQSQMLRQGSEREDRLQQQLQQQRAHEHELGRELLALQRQLQQAH